MDGSIDRINMRTMSSASAVMHYARRSDLSIAERACVDRVADMARGKPIVDIGVGGGRTVASLLEVSTDYLGIDNSQEMIDACRRRFPDVRFARADARELSEIDDGSVFLAMFSCNGIGMVSHQDRLRILREVHRVLQPGGVFLFSTHNRDSVDYTSTFRFPKVEWSRHPVRALVRSLRFVGHTAIRIFNRLRFKAHEIHTDGYSVVNDVCHHYGTMLYYIGLANQRRQLEEAGFLADAEAYDLDGRPILDGSDHDSIAFVAHKAA